MTDKNSNRLTDRKVNSFKPAAKPHDHLDAGQAGLRLRVLPAGRKVWYYRGRLNGADRWRNLGDYNKEVLNVAAARIKAAETRAAFHSGKDPDAETRAEVYTLGDLWRVYLTEAQNGSRKPTGVHADVLNWGTFLKPWAARPLAEVTTAEVRSLLQRIAARKVTRTNPKTKKKKTHGGPTAANRTRALLSAMWRYADDETHPPNPCTKAAAPRVEVKRKTYIKPGELAAFLDAVRAEGGDFADLILLGLLTGLRRANLTGLRWEWVGELSDDGTTWRVDPDNLNGAHPGVRIPPEHFKGNRAHCVALVPEAVEVLRRRAGERESSPWVFPSTRSHTGHRGLMRRQWAKLVPFLACIDRDGNEHPDPRPGWHALRHTLARSLGKDYVTVAGVLGHSMAAMFGVTADYGRPSPEHYRAALESAAVALLIADAEVVSITDRKAK